MACMADGSWEMREWRSMRSVSHLRQDFRLRSHLREYDFQLRSASDKQSQKSLLRSLFATFHLTDQNDSL
jgi:hypothetical protein